MFSFALIDVATVYIYYFSAHLFLFFLFFVIKLVKAFSRAMDRELENELFLFLSSLYVGEQADSCRGWVLGYASKLST